MRIALLTIALLVPASLAAQPPAPDAPMARHAAYLLESAREGFAPLFASVPFAPSTVPVTAEVDSRHVMRYGGAAVRSQLRVNRGWNVLHVSWLPVAAGPAAADSALARLTAELAAVIPAGWRRIPSTPGFEGWVECGFAGRELSLQRSLPSQQPAITLIVYKFDKPCDNTGTAGSRPPE